jgi:hypothetical protein
MASKIFCRGLQMSKYCDTKILEMNWYDWLVASSVPELEMYRKLGILWTKVPGEVLGKNGKPIEREGIKLSNPCFPHRLHCLALAQPVFFESLNTAVNSVGVVRSANTSREIALSDVNKTLNLESNSPLHLLENPLEILDSTIPLLVSLGYRKDKETHVSWHAILKDVNNMCMGIASKFNPASVEEQEELAHEALIQVINKLQRKKLVYTPGRAPVFNLLTTTIYRCMYSIKNKTKNQKIGLAKLVEHIQTGAALPLRSYRVANSQ